MLLLVPPLKDQRSRNPSSSNGGCSLHLIDRLKQKQTCSIKYLFIGLIQFRLFCLSLVINIYFPGSEQQEQLMPVIVTIKLISVQFLLKLPAKTELGNKYILSRVGAAGAAYACYSDNKAYLSTISVEIAS